MWTIGFLNLKDDKSISTTLNYIATTLNITTTLTIITTWLNHTLLNELYVVGGKYLLLIIGVQTYTGAGQDLVFPNTFRSETSSIQQFL